MCMCLTHAHIHKCMRLDAHKFTCVCVNEKVSARVDLDTLTYPV